MNPQLPCTFSPTAFGLAAARGLVGRMTDTPITLTNTDRNSLLRAFTYATSISHSTFVLSADQIAGEQGLTILTARLVSIIYERREITFEMEIRGTIDEVATTVTVQFTVVADPRAQMELSTGWIVGVSFQKIQK